ncbi:glutamine--fructose-6-phosphate transaminase (isomerizing) [Haladaptatus sp. NG-WS-4]
MCGIIGYVGSDVDPVRTLLNGLSKLEYRGYDSTGLAVANSDIHVVKREGDLNALKQEFEAPFDLTGAAGIGHTRWSTHGEPSDDNAHPHTDCDKRVAVVHNGIIENYQALRDEFRAVGHEFESETDTEVVPHIISHYLEEGLSPKSAFRAAINDLDGSYAIAAIFENRDEVMVARRDSSLVLGAGDRATYVASDMTALVDYTDSVVHLDDDEFAFLSEDGYTVVDSDGVPQAKQETAIEWDAEAMGKGGYEHYMIKEIHEQSTALRDCLRNRFTDDRQFVDLDVFPNRNRFERIHLVACGTSYHAALYGAHVLRERGLPTQAFLASEYALNSIPLEDGTLVVAVTQSGETADTLSALRTVDRRNGATLALTNVVDSTAARECDDVLYIRSGPEISVAATKTFASQLAMLQLLALELPAKDPMHSTTEARKRISALRDLPGQIQNVLDTTDASTIARRYVDESGYFFIGRGRQYPVALEGALKMKEITYKQAEGFAAGELKHGPLALVTEETPVFVSVVGDDEYAHKTIANAKEVTARGAPLIAITDDSSSIRRYADEVLTIPSTDPGVAPILVNIQYQLLAYYTADLLGREIDKPRNLAKSVTVE